ncbi:MAG: hypothetical protein U1E25_14630 [Methylocystis sp.]
MAVPSWPAELPQRVLRDGYSEKLRDGRLFSRTQSAPGKVRRRYSSAVLPITASIIIDETQKSRLERFWYEDTGGGTLPFVIPDQTHDGLPMLDNFGNPVITDAGAEILITANWLARFSENGGPQFTPWGLQFQAAFQLDVLP